MEFFGIFVTLAILTGLAIIGYTVWTVWSRKGKVPPQAPGHVPEELSTDTPVNNPGNIPDNIPNVKARVDWRVYAVESDGNCMNGSDIVLKTEQDEFVMGRAEGCGLRLMRPQIGRRHAMVTRKGIVYTYYDLGSKAGSVCNGEKIQSRRLEHMLVIWVYDVALVFANCEIQQELIALAVKNSHR